MFVSAAYLVFDLRARRVTLATAGHPSPFLIRRTDRSITPLRTSYAECGPALGIAENTVYGHRHSELQSGDRVVIYTDGILEIEGPDRAEFGDQRLHECISRHLDLDTGSMLERVVRAAEDYGGGHGFDDDICLVAVDVAGLPGE